MRASLLAFSLLLTSTWQSPTDSGIGSVLAVLVDAATADAAKSLPADIARGPLLVDTRSFILHGSMAADRELTTHELHSAIRRPFRPAAASDAIRCTSRTPSGEADHCLVIENGLYLELLCLSRTRSGYQALLMYEWTRTWGSGDSTIGVRQLRVWLTGSEGRWVVKETKVVMAT